MKKIVSTKHFTFNSIHLKKPFVVIVDDNADDRFLLNEALHTIKLELNILEVENGEDAISFIEHKCRKNTPNFILLDLNMPKKNGFEVLQFLQENPETCKSKIIVLSTSSNTSDISKAIKLGAIDYIVKPDCFSEYIRLAEKLRLHIN